jgi:SAM-dependent methyltransferase
MWHKLLRLLSPQQDVVYGSSFFRQQWFQGWQELQPVLAQLITEAGRWRNVLDFGCGPGVMIDPMTANGFNYVGCDYSEEAKDLYLERFGRHPDRYVSQLCAVNLADFDVLLSFDVFEHMTDQEITELLEASRQVPDLFVNISRERRTPGHINIKSDRGWRSFFERHGLELCEETTRILRESYTKLRPGCPDLWNRNMFVLSRRGLQSSLSSPKEVSGA